MADDLLPIPERTLKRDGKYQDAARLYIHKRITNFAELARIVGLPNTVHLLRVKDSDKWEEFAAGLASKALKSVWGELSRFDGWAADTFERVRDERDRQIALLPRLVAERERVLAQVDGFEVGSKPHSSAVASLRGLTALLSDITGLDRWWKAMELASRGKGEQLPAPQARETRGAVIDL